MNSHNNDKEKAQKCLVQEILKLLSTCLVLIKAS